MTCENCLHFKACCEMAAAFGTEEINILYANKCEDFANRSEWVHLPCKVGEKTFLLLERTSGGFDIVKSKCIRITDNGYGKRYSMYFDCAEIGNTLEYDIDDFGKWVFLTREEAEKVLEKEK